MQYAVTMNLMIRPKPENEGEYNPYSGNFLSYNSTVLIEGRRYSDIAPKIDRIENLLDLLSSKED